MKHAHKHTTAVCSPAVTELANEHTKVCCPQAHPAWSSTTEESLPSSPPYPEPTC